MLLWTALTIAIIAGLLQPFASRLHATGLWAGKALVPPEAASAYPRGVQDALTDGWPSAFCLTVSLTPYLATIIGFFYSWWAGIVAFLTTVFVQVIAGRTSIASKSVDRYLAVLMDHATRRAANYTAKGDTQRSEVAHGLAQQLAGLLEIYLNSGIPSPTVKESRRAPHGEPEHLYHLAKETMKKLFPLILIVLSACASSAAPDRITPAQAKDHVGKQASVCGVVASANFANRSRGRPTFLNLDKAYPDHIFTAVIWGDDRPKFGTPETLKGRRVCVSGLVESYQGKPQVVLRDASQLRPE
jgi:hypothetical protein